MKKEAELEEKNKLQNFIPRLDSDEVEYLQSVDKMKEEEENLKLAEEKKALAEYQAAIVHLTAEEQEKKMSEFKTLLHGKKRSEGESSKETKFKKGSQAALLSGIIKRSATKSTNNERNESQRTSSSETNSGDSSGQGEKRKRDEKGDGSIQETAKSQKTNQQDKEEPSPPPSSKTFSFNNTGATKCIGILPGIGLYVSDSSDSDASSSDSEVEQKNRTDELCFSLIPKIPQLHTHASQETQK